MIIGPFTTRILESFTPWAGSPNLTAPPLLPGSNVFPSSELFAGTANNLTIYLIALGSMYDTFAPLVVDSGFPDDSNYVPGWSILLDPDHCPAQYLPYLAQFNGTQVAPGTDDATARAIIKAESGFQRGTAASIVGAAKRNLTGTQSVALLERTPDQYAFVLVVRPEELASANALTAAVNAVKPAGIVWTLVQSDEWTIFQMESSFATITALEAAFTTVTGLERDQLGH